MCSTRENLTNLKCNTREGYLVCEPVEASRYLSRINLLLHKYRGLIFERLPRVKIAYIHKKLTIFRQ